MFKETKLGDLAVHYSVVDNEFLIGELGCGVEFSIDTNTVYIDVEIWAQENDDELIQSLANYMHENNLPSVKEAIPKLQSTNYFKTVLLIDYTVLDDICKNYPEGNELLDRLLTEEDYKKDSYVSVHKESYSKTQELIFSIVSETTEEINGHDYFMVSV